MTKKRTLEEFREQAKKVHKGKYNYDNITEYRGNIYKVPIECYIHGIFLQTPDKHLLGQGCPKCARNYHGDTVEFINKAKKVHDGFYSYKKTNYESEDKEVIITCPVHGDFHQTPHIHLRGKGCPECGKIKMIKTISKEEFIRRANVIHNGKYNYEKIKFNHTSEEGIITCPIHGDFKQKIDTHLQGCGCPICGNILSKKEKEIYDYLCNKLGEDNVISRNRDIIGNGQELDIFLPQYNLAIEYNGTRWHSEEFNKGKEYHLKKTELCNSKGINLIHIFDYEYNSHKEIILSRINNILGINKLNNITLNDDIEIKEISNNESNLFYQKYSIENINKEYLINIGCYYKGELVIVASFNEEVNNKSYVMENYATDNRYCYEHIGNEVISYFMNIYSPVELYAYADRNWINDKDNNYLTLLDFKFDSIIEPTYKIYDNRYKVWNCGYFKYIFR